MDTIFTCMRTQLVLCFAWFTCCSSAKLQITHLSTLLAQIDANESHEFGAPSVAEVPRLDIHEFLSGCSDTCHMELKTDLAKCELRIQVDSLVLYNCHGRNRPKQDYVVDGLGAGNCCKAWSDKAPKETDVGVPCMSAADQSSNDAGCEIGFSRIRVISNAWGKLALKISFGVDRGVRRFAVFRSAKLKGKTGTLAQSDPFKSWLLNDFHANPESLMEALAFVTSSEVQANHESWYGAADTTAQLDTNIGYMSAADWMKAKFVSVFDRLPMAHFLGMCSSVRSAKCEMHIKSAHFKCTVQVNAEDPQCYLKLSSCRKRTSSTGGGKPIAAETAFPRLCLSAEGCCLPAKLVQVDRRAGSGYRLFGGLESGTLVSEPTLVPKGEGFDHAYLIASNDDWACSTEVPARKCAAGKQVARFLRTDLQDREPEKGRSLVPGAVLMSAISGTLFRDARRGNLDIDLCVSSGLAQANRLRHALWIKAISGLVAATLALPLGQFGPLTIAVKLLMRIMAGGHYAETSCIFEVSSLFPAYRDQLMETDGQHWSGTIAGKKFWSYGAAAEMQKCMDAKNKLFRTAKSGAYALAGGVYTGTSFIATSGAAAATGVIKDAAQLVKGVGNSMPVLNVAGTSLPLIGIFLGIAEAIAGLHQAHTLYNWARFQTYRSCSVGQRAGIAPRLQRLVQEYENGRNEVEKLQQTLMPRYSRSRRLFICMGIDAKRAGDTTMERRIQEKHEKLVQAVMQIADTSRRMDDILIQLHKITVMQHEAVKFLQRKNMTAWMAKERREFSAELALNPAYFLLETLFPNDKYVDVEAALRKSQQEVEVEKQRESERYVATDASVREVELQASSWRPVFCDAEIKTPGGSLLNELLAEIEEIRVVIKQITDKTREMTPIVEQVHEEGGSIPTASEILARF